MPRRLSNVCTLPSLGSISVWRDMLPVSGHGRDSSHTWQAAKGRGSAAGQKDTRHLAGPDLVLRAEALQPLSCIEQVPGHTAVRHAGMLVLL